MTRNNFTKGLQKLIIDFHTHAFPDTLAPRAIPILTEKSELIPFHNGTVSGLIEKMDEYGVDKSVLLSIATKPTQENSVNTFTISLLENERIIPFGSVFPGSDTYKEQLIRLADAGVKGIKLHPEYQDFYIDSEDALKIYDICGVLGLIVHFHSGEDEAYKPPVHANPERVNIICEKCPKTTFVAAHFGGYNMWEEFSEKLKPHENLYLDTSMTRTKQKINNQTAINTINKMGIEHILLGSDSPWEKQIDSINGIKSLNLSENDTNLIFSENAKRLLKI